MSKLSASLATLLAVPALALASTAYAVAPGQIEGGDIYRIKNLTKNVDFTDPASADACNELMYKVRIHNPGPSPITEVKVKATVVSGVATSHTSTVTVSSPTAMPTTTEDTATVNLSSAQSLTYVSGSTQLLDTNNNFISNLPDGITNSGVNIGTVGVSVGEKRFVQFKVKVSCPQPPAPKVKFACTALDVTKVSRTRFDFTAHASVTNATVQSYVFTTKDANGNTVDTKTVTTSALSANYTFERDVVGTYIVTAVVNTDKGSVGVIAVCTKKVTVDAVPVVQPETTQPLPKTGAAGVAGLFAGASALGTAGHYVYRRFRQ